MQLHLHDFQTLDIDLDVADPITVGELRSQLNPKYETLNSLIFRNGRALNDATVLQASQFTENNVLAIFNRNIFPEKSFPSDQPPARFRRSRFSAFFVPDQKPSEKGPEQAPVPEPVEDNDVPLPRRFWFTRRRSGDNDAPMQPRSGIEVREFMNEMAQHGILPSVIYEALSQSHFDFDATRQALLG
jgi:hypothetical protein